MLRDPAHEVYEERLEWLGGFFDPEAFSLAANRRFREKR